MLQKTQHQKKKKQKQLDLKMNKRPEQVFFQRDYADGQHAHEKMIDITSHQGNTN